MFYSRKCILHSGMPWVIAKGNTFCVIMGAYYYVIMAPKSVNLLLHYYTKDIRLYQDYGLSLFEKTPVEPN